MWLVYHHACSKYQISVSFPPLSVAHCALGYAGLCVLGQVAVDCYASVILLCLLGKIFGFSLFPSLGWDMVVPHGVYGMSPRH